MDCILLDALRHAGLAQSGSKMVATDDLRMTFFCDGQRPDHISRLKTTDLLLTRDSGLKTLAYGLQTCLPTDSSLIPRTTYSDAELQRPSNRWAPYSRCRTRR